MANKFYSDFSVLLSERLYSSLHGYTVSDNPVEISCLDRNLGFYLAIPEIDVVVTFIHEDSNGAVPPSITTSLRNFYCCCVKLSSLYTVDNYGLFFDVLLQLSGCSHFSYNEFINSPTASVIGCCNVPVGPKGRIFFCNYIVFSHILESVRRILHRPVLITSGYRCARLNSAVGGAKNSYHTRYRAVDIAVTPSEASSLQPLLTSRFEAKEFIVGSDYLHIAF